MTLMGYPPVGQQQQHQALQGEPRTFKLIATSSPSNLHQQRSALLQFQLLRLRILSLSHFWDWDVARIDLPTLR